jgi:hypothetical protein
MQYSMVTQLSNFVPGELARVPRNAINQINHDDMATYIDYILHRTSS